MFIKETLLNSVNQILKQAGVTEGPLQVIKTVAGGSINSCFQLASGSRRYFLKVNSRSRYPGMFLKEAMGLKQLGAAGCILTPGVITYGEVEGEQFLVLEWIEKGINSDDAQERLGAALAAMHKNSNPAFGLGYDNYMGSLPQSNSFHDNWTDFFITERLRPQIQMAFDMNLADKTLLDRFERLFLCLDNLFPKEKPALIHGDLWSGNYMVSKEGEPVLIDPAITYGHREADIAMTTLFGGFSPRFYESYHKGYPLEKGWEKRISLWNLYPLLIHLNLFGKSYLEGIKAALSDVL